jgi:hypothetical protein
MVAWPEQVKGRFFFWLGLIAIALLYCLYYFYFIYGLSFSLNLRERHAVKFLFILVTYGIGAFMLPRSAAGWTIRIWHVAYGAGLLLLVLLGIYDWGFARTPLQVRFVADDLQELLISPILFCVIGLLDRSVERFSRRGPGREG